MSNRHTFQNKLRDELNAFIAEQNQRFPKDNVLRMDMHCHDYNSDVPDELIGRILNVPETWISSETLLQTLEQNGSSAYTITNHNNARSCYALQEKGLDILTAAEFSCKVPDFNVGIHVLTYGFTRDQEKKLNKLRSNIYDFQRFTKEHNIPTIWAHPLYYYTHNSIPQKDFFDKMALLFERFEVINGQRDTWQNLLVKEWVESLSEEKINRISENLGIAPDEYCLHPYKKSMSAGSDSHMGIFSGQSGSELYIPNLEDRMKITSTSQLALEAIRRGDMAPFSAHGNSERMTIAFLDYFCQIALFRKDAGLLRLILHKGSVQDKLLALGITNGFAELKRHKITMKFIETFHDCFGGTPPGNMQRVLIPKTYKPVFDEARNIANYRREGGIEMGDKIHDSIFTMYTHLSKVLASRVNKKIGQLKKNNDFKKLQLSEIIDGFEIPSEIRAYLGSDGEVDEKPFKSLDIAKWLNGLSFPFLASNVMLAAHFTSTKVLYNTRPLLNQFSNELGKLQHPKRVLWLSDSFDEKNGVAIVLREILKEVQKRDLPIDFMICSNTIQPEDHLTVVPAIAEFELPVYQKQEIRVPNFFEIHRLFLEGEYDRIICSTEGPMGLVSLYLKHAYHVPAHFYIHTDWLMFARKVLHFDQSSLSRLRRLLRAYYGTFDKLLVLNKDQQKYFSSKAMAYPEDKVHLTAHWVDQKFHLREVTKKEAFNLEDHQPVLLFTGRVSKEKGVMELPEIYAYVKKHIPDVKLVITGSGPDTEKLKTLIPEAIMLGWVEHDKLPELYSAADLLLLPSRFDTFSCVVLEALSCSLPVIAYNTKGPRDIIQHDATGYLVKDTKEMAMKAVDLLNDKKQLHAFKKEACIRSKAYTADQILAELMETIGM